MEVAEDVRGGAEGGVLIPTGTPVSATVARSKGAGAFGRAGRLELRCESIRLANGTEVPLGSAGGPARQGGDRAVVALVGGGLVGAGAWLAVMGATFGSGGAWDFRSDTGAAMGAGIGIGLLTAALIHGRNATARAGDTFTVTVAKDTAIAAGARDEPAPATR